MKAVGIGSSQTEKDRVANDDNLLDNLLIDDELGLYVVGAGSAGYSVGDPVARRALAVVRQHIVHRHQLITGIRQGWAGWSAEGLLQSILAAAVVDACRVLADESPGQIDRDCAVTALLVGNEYAAMAQVGDGRLYRYRRGCVDPLGAPGASDPTVPGDHTVEHRGARVVSTLIAPVAGDYFVLATPELRPYLDAPRSLASVLDTTPLEDSADALISLASTSDGRRLASLVVLLYEPLTESMSPSPFFATGSASSVMSTHEAIG